MMANECEKPAKPSGRRKKTACIVLLGVGVAGIIISLIVFSFAWANFNSVDAVVPVVVGLFMLSVFFL